LVLSSSCSNQLGCPGTPPTANHIPKICKIYETQKKKNKGTKTILKHKYLFNRKKLKLGAILEHFNNIVQMMKAIKA
jgi:hypothetical protein